MSEKAKQSELLTVVETAERLFVTERTVRNWLKGNDLPSSESGKGRMLEWRTTLAWYVGYKAEELGNDGNGSAPDGNVSAPDGNVGPEETYEAALSRKTRAEADLKELQLAKARGEVASISDVERVLTSSNIAIQTQMLAVPSRLATQLLGQDDHARVVTILTSEIRQVLSNLASAGDVREASGLESDFDAED